MNDDSAPWIGDDGPSRRILEAAGSIMFITAEMEGTLLILLEHFLRVPGHVLRTLYLSLNNRGRVDILTRLSESDDHPADKRSAVALAMRVFDLCAENRNVVAHSSFARREGNKFVFLKHPITSGAWGWSWAVREADLQAIAMEMVLADNYLTQLWGVLAQVDYGPDDPLPERPLQPRKLSLFRLPEDRQDVQPPPQS